MDYEEVLMFKIAWYYYIEGLTQQKIAELVGISRMRVIKLLEKAHQAGIVQIKIREDNVARIQSEKHLIEKYELSDAYVVPTNPNYSETNETIAKAAAMYISDRIEDNTFVNIGYGDTLSRVLNNITKQTDKNVSFVSLTGGVNYYLQNMQHSFKNSTLHLIPAPLLASTKEMVSAIRKEGSVKEISRLVKLSSMTVLGIGAMDDSATVFKNGIFTNNDKLYLKMQGAVGDLLCHFIDKDGNIIQSGFEDRLISTPLETIKSLSNVIGVAAGESKIDAIKAALKGNYLDVLITDEMTALKLTEE